MGKKIVFVYTYFNQNFLRLPTYNYVIFLTLQYLYRSYIYLQNDKVTPTSLTPRYFCSVILYIHARNNFFLKISGKS